MAVSRLFSSNALVSVEFQLSGISGGRPPVHVYVIKEGVRQEVTIAIQHHGVEPSPQHQVTMPVSELIAFGRLCVALGKLFLGVEETK